MSAIGACQFLSLYERSQSRQPLRRWLRHARLSSLLTALSLVSGCVSLALAPTLTPSAASAETGGWETLAPGLERRVFTPDPSNLLSQLVVLRIDPAYFTFHAYYRPGDPLSVQRWQESLPGAVAIVNGNFFTPENAALGLVIVDGLSYGESFVGQGGTFQVQAGLPRVRSNILEPYQGEALEQAVQGFPMLVVDAQTNAARLNDTDSSRRTVVAQDSYGRILLMVTPLLGLTLADLSAYLPTTDMEIVNALNLDGGGSTLMYLNSGSSPYMVRSFDPVPVVLAVYPK
jgi:uncharacterized protein YigE (DUF2233 family)